MTEAQTLTVRLRATPTYHYLTAHLRCNEIEKAATSHACVCYTTRSWNKKEKTTEPATEIYSRPAQLSPGRTGGGRPNGRREASRPLSPSSRRTRPCPDLQFPWRAGVACYSQRRPDRGRAGTARLVMRPPTRRSAHPYRCMYAHITRRGTRGWVRRKVAVLGCGRALFSVSSPHSSSGFTRHTTTPAHYQTVAPRVGKNI